MFPLCFHDRSDGAVRECLRVTAVLTICRPIELTRSRQQRAEEQRKEESYHLD